MDVAVPIRPEVAPATPGWDGPGAGAQPTEGEHDPEEHDAGEHQGQRPLGECGDQQRSGDRAGDAAGEGPAGAAEVDVLALGESPPAG